MGCRLVDFRSSVLGACVCWAAVTSRLLTSHDGQQPHWDNGRGAEVAGAEYSVRQNDRNPALHSNETQHRTVYIDEVYEAGFSLWSRRVCRRARGAALLVLVVSARAHAAARRAVRRAWRRWLRAGVVALGFVLARGGGGGRGGREEDAIRLEAARHGDVVVSRGAEGFRGLPLRSLALLSLAARCGAPAVLKLDDDVHVNVPRLLALVRAAGGDNRTIWGSVYKRCRAHRRPHSKYYLSREEYPGVWLPEFVRGPAYLLAGGAARALLAAAGVGAGVRAGGGGGRVPYLPLEDVLVTGVLADRAGVRRRDVHNFLVHSRVLRHESLVACILRRVTCVHPASPAQLRRLPARRRAPCAPALYYG